MRPLTTGKPACRGQGAPYRWLISGTAIGAPPLSLVLPAARFRLPFGPGSKRRKRMPLRLTASRVAAVVVAFIGASVGAVAQTPEQFYAGKAIDLVIGYPPAGSNDLYARLLARHFSRHMPGNPVVVPKNMPGAGSFLALANVYNVAPKDGTVIGIGASTAPLDEKLGTQ